MQAIKQIIFDKIPTQVHTLPEKNKPAVWLSKDKAIKHERIKLYGTERHLLMIDYDASDDNNYTALSHGIYALEPNYIIHNRLSHQAGWLLEKPVYSQAAVRNNHPYRYLKAIENAFDRTYGTDPHFGRYISRNPLFDDKKTIWLHDQAFTLKELADSVDLECWNEQDNDEHGVIQTIKGTRTLNSESTKYGRDSDIFDNLRFWAYRQDTKNQTYNDWINACTTQAIIFNNYENPLPKNKVLSVARSVAQYTYNRPTSYRETFEEYVARTHTSKIQARRGSIGGKKSKRKPESDSEAFLKPWKMLGISRATFYRNKAK
jgi:hypothetical protein